MARRFFDTSAFAKRYRNERGTARIDAFLGETGSHHVISALGVVELHSILARLVREGEITGNDFDLARRRFLADIASGLWKVLPVTPADFHHAQQLLVRHGHRRSVRTLDAIQLAVSLANPGNPFDAFVCADGNLCLVAAAEGQIVMNPEDA
jgi:predicted nucleic acid-binding protein